MARIWLSPVHPSTGRLNALVKLEIQDDLIEQRNAVDEQWTIAALGGVEIPDDAPQPEPVSLMELECLDARSGGGERDEAHILAAAIIECATEQRSADTLRSLALNDSDALDLGASRLVCWNNLDKPDDLPSLLRDQNFAQVSITRNLGFGIVRFSEKRHERFARSGMKRK